MGIFAVIMEDHGKFQANTYFFESAKMLNKKRTRDSCTSGLTGHVSVLVGEH